MEMMLHCLNTSGSVSNGAELTSFERQIACMKRQQQQQQRGLQYSNVYSTSGNEFQAQVCGELSGLGKDDSRNEYSYHTNKTASCPVSAIGENSEGKDFVLTGRTSPRRDNSKKRKADMATSLKAVTDNDTKVKKINECAEDGESKITQQNRVTNSKNKQIKGEASADSSKVSDVQKTDYIHVRARRGQATDSHSLAERVRREKISKKMKYLQELVPGCHKITGKARMLDEIINYVKSLQSQVEVFQTCASSFPTLGAASEMTNPSYSQCNHLEEVISTGIDLQNYQPDMGLQVQLTETYAETNSFNQIQQNYSNWDAELQNLFNY